MGTLFPLHNNFQILYTHIEVILICGGYVYTHTYIDIHTYSSFSPRPDQARTEIKLGVQNSPGAGTENVVARNS